jgi:hypothetical protein
MGKNTTGNRELRSRSRRHGDQPMDESGQDPYRPNEKLPEPTYCPRCNAVYQAGRWQWLPRPNQAHEQACPACRRTADRFPAGFLTLSGPFLTSHRDEIVQLLRNEEERESAEHPLQRIIDITEQGDKTIVTTTDLKIAERLGQALERAYQGSLDVKFAPHEYRVRIAWTR